MNKRLTMIIAGIVLAGAIIAFVANNSGDSSNKNNPASSSQTKNVSKQNTEQPQKVSGSLSTLSASGKAQECDISSSGENGVASGKLYSDGKGRGLMEIDLATEKVNTGKSHFLTTAEAGYSWIVTGDKTIAFKLDKDQLSKNTTPTSTSTPSNNSNQSFDMSCKSWNVDEAKLTVPSDINFISFPAVPGA